MNEGKLKFNIYGAGSPLVLLGIFAGEEKMAEEVFALSKEFSGGKDFTLIAFETQNWDDDLSPWETTGLTEKDSFKGMGKYTQNEIKNALTGDFKAGIFDKIYIAGYSLAGLFALWSSYDSDLFDGCACCSGSLWFNGWSDFIRENHIKKPSIVYLSLGGKEEKTSNPVMATIGDATRLQDRLLDKEPNVLKHKLEMNPGGHFANPAKRLAKGIAWLIENTEN